MGIDHMPTGKQEKSEEAEAPQAVALHIEHLQEELMSAPLGTVGRQEALEAARFVQAAIEVPVMGLFSSGQEQMTTMQVENYKKILPDMRANLHALLKLPETADCVRMGLDAHVLFERYRKHNLVEFEPVIEESEWRRPELQESISRCVTLLSAPQRNNDSTE